MRRFWIIVGLGLLAAFAVSEGADPRPAKPDKKSKRTREIEDMGELTPGREAAALTFADQHHPELADLLRNLKKDNRRQYDRALKSIFATSERLARLKTRDPDRYRLSLRNWELESRIRLLAVRSSISDDAELENQLRELLLERVDVQLNILKLEQDRLARRQDNLKKNIDRILEDKDAAAQRELNRLKRSLGVFRKDKKPRRARQQPVSAKDHKQTKKNPRNKKPADKQ
jgi:hypothetical protein